MTSGAVLSTIISVGTTPIISRLYVKSDFGIFSIFISSISLLGMLATAFFPNAFVIPKYRKDFLALLKISLFCLFISLFLIIISLTLFKEKLTNIFGLEGLSQFLWIIPIGVFIHGLHNIASNWNIRQAKFGRNATSTISNKLTNRGLSISLGVINGSSPFGLIIPYLVSLSVSLFVLFNSRMSKYLLYLKNVPRIDIRNAAFEYSKYPSYILPSNFINKFTSDLPIYILAIKFSTDITGAFSFAIALMNIPFTIIGNSIASVFHQKANEIYHTEKKKLLSFTEDIHNRMLLFGSIAFGFIFGFGDYLFSFIFGNEWNLAGHMAMYLSIFFIYRLISAPLVKVFTITRKEQFSLYINLLLAALRIGGIVGGAFLGKTPLYAVFGFSLGNLIGYFISNFLVFKVLKANLRKIILIDLLYICIAFMGWWLIRFILINFNILS